MNGTTTNSPRAQFTIDRIYNISIYDLWDLWTSKAGIESWWGPEGFNVTVNSIDLRPSGQLLYLMTATAPEPIAFMKRQGMPLTTECRVTFTEVIRPSRLAYKTLTDFVPDVPAYEVNTVVELEAVADGVKLTVTSEALQDDVWTERARAGHLSQLRKLEALIEDRNKTVRP